MSYKHLSLAERHYIKLESKRGKSFTHIATILGRSQSYISREVKRNTGKRGYRYKQATKIANARHTQKNKAIKLTSPLKDLINGF